MPKTPEDYGMSYEEVSFQSADGVRLAAWYIPAETESRKLILMTHPMLHTRYGFVPPEELKPLLPERVEFQNTVRHLHQGGYNVLFMDFRNHGKSGEGSNGVCGVGVYEWQDVVGMMDYVNNDEDLSKMDKGFLSFCMGANSTIRAMSQEPDKFESVKFLLAVQPVSMALFMEKVYLLNDPSAGSKELAEMDDVVKRKGLSLKEMSPATFLKDLNIPVMYVQLKADIFTDPSDVQSFYDNTPSAKKELLWLDGEHHRFYAFNYFGNEPEKMLSFIGKNLD